MFPSYAHRLAEQIIRTLQPYCIRIDACGSLRRHRSPGTKLEILCVPQSGFITSGDSTVYAPITAFGDALVQLASAINFRKLDLPGYQLEVGDYLVDVLVPDPRDYYRQLAMRSASRDYVKDILVPAWEKLGWVDSDDGLRRRDQCVATGRSWICHHPTPDFPPTWFSEADFYAWLRVTYLHPSDRSVPMFEMPKSTQPSLS
ncbi:MAG: hypothetical protein EOP50_00265 [Sphingobacteriales bacterium]|nr:MAG: hypothetical protein EOP50_00265 [Sphingobacteriales bacterium]